MIEVEHVKKSFKSVVAVEDIHFTAQNGEVTALLGHNGAGKTTCIRMMTALVKPDSGRVLIDGHNVMDDPIKARTLIGVLPDSQGLYPRLTTREHLLYFAGLQGMSKDEAAVRSEVLINKLEMRKIADRRTQGFSQGERMKVSLARALIHDPPNLLLDEPTNGLDVRATRSVRSLLKEIEQEGKCILFSSHVMQEVTALCSQIVVVAAGRVLAHGTIEEILEISKQKTIEDAFVVLSDAAEMETSNES